MGYSWKALTSLLLLAHFFAILTATLAQPMPGQPAPYLAVWMHSLARPYLDALFLNSSFRFYAPNPGPVKLCWFRLERNDGTAEWVEFPRHRTLAPWPIYHRELAVVSFWDAQIGPDPQNSKQLTLSPPGQIGIASFIRRIREEHDHDSNPLEVVDLYTVHHRAAEPSQIAAGWTPYDLRLYRICHVGRFLPDGQPPANQSPQAVESSRVAARILSDRRSFASHHTSDQLVNWPRPVQELILNHPKLVQRMSEDEAKQRIEQIAKSADESLAKQSSRIFR
jgi:hypothetical protein